MVFEKHFSGVKGIFNFLTFSPRAFGTEGTLIVLFSTGYINPVWETLINLLPTLWGGLTGREVSGLFALPSILPQGGREVVGTPAEREVVGEISQTGGKVAGGFSQMGGGCGSIFSQA